MTDPNVAELHRMLAELRQEYEQRSVLTDDMLRYAMAAMGTGSPKEAERLRLFWRFAMEARDSGPNVRGNAGQTACTEAKDAR